MMSFNSGTRSDMRFAFGSSASRNASRQTCRRCGATERATPAAVIPAPSAMAPSRRRAMITTTYGVSGVLLALSGYLFSIGALSAQGQTIAWMVIFFFASPAASAAYLTVSETFPLEIRALAIALFYAIGTAIGGVAGPALFGVLIDTGSRHSVFLGYLLGSALMIAAAMIAFRHGVAAERKSLEEIARPLAALE